jgi:hypothetical protein
MASRKYGIPEALANLHYKTLTSTKYRVNGCSHSSKTPIYETGQGSGNNPIIWFFMTDIIVQIIEENAIVATYLDEDPRQTIEIKMTTYVDDINTHHTNKSETHNIEINMRYDYNT